MNYNQNIFTRKSFLFAVKIIQVSQQLMAEKEFILSKQLTRSGTAIGALIREAQNAESKLDFIHKLAIAQKECDETIYWIELLFETEYIQQEDFILLRTDATELLKLIRSSIVTTKQKINKQ